jgi:hypothetical protein
MDIDLKDLNFGVPAAERDNDLLSCFVSTETYNNLSKGTKSIILGNRGTGKSALFRKIADEEKSRGNIVISLAPEEYSYELLSLTLKKETEGSWLKHGAYSAAWKYLIYVTIMKNICKEGKTYKRGEEARIYNYLRDNHINTDTNPIGMLISYLKRMEGIKIGTYEASIKARELGRLYSLETIEPLLNDIEIYCRNKNIIVLVDELDKGWDASEDAIAFVAGLFQAAVFINNKLHNVRILISLRKELYDNIPTLYEDAQKVRDIIETIEWDEPKLLELIARRITKKFPSLKDDKDDYENVWNKIFSEVLDYRQTKSFNYIVDRTLYRPREIIQFCNDVADHIRQSLLSAQLPFNYKQIAEAEYGYSETRVKDICAEYRFQYPGLQSIMETFRGKSYNYERSVLENHIISIVVGEVPLSKDATSWVNSLDPEALIDVLWAIGFIRAQAVGGAKARRRSGSEYLGSYQVSSLNLRNIKRFHVHPMFRSFLGLKESKT